jgi:hypothetical protein
MNQSLKRLGKTSVVVSGIAMALSLSGCRNVPPIVTQPSGAASPSAAYPPTSGPPDVHPPGSHSPGAHSPGSHSPGTHSPGVRPPGGGNPSATTRLTITVRKASHAKAAVTHTLTCDPVGGDLPRAKAACAVLRKAKAHKTHPFAPAAMGKKCSRTYGGPEVATVKGVWDGKKIDAKFSRENYCTMRRWARLAPLFGPVSKAR